MKARDVMLTSVAAVRPDAPLREVAASMAEEGGVSVLVVDQAGEVIGIISEAMLGEALTKICQAQESGWIAPESGWDAGARGWATARRAS